MSTRMEIECSKCHQKFNSSKEDTVVCPQCLRSEFATVASGLDEVERKELHEEYAPSMKRQTARAEMMFGEYESGQMFSVAGKLRLLLGLIIFMVCGLLFLISDKEAGVTFLAELDMDSQRIFSMILCVASAALIAASSVRYKKLVRIAAVLVLVMGWTMPDMLDAALKAKAKQKAKIVAAAEAELNETQTKEELTEGPVLNDDDLQVFYTLRSASHRISHYAVFIDNQDGRARSLMREALNRLLEAEYTRAYTRANGALYVATNVPGERRNISRLLSRFGTVTHAEPAKGVYEVRFDADRANLVSQYSPDVLSSPLNNSYVTANLSELRCVDPMRVRMSARSLASSNVKVLRREIRDTLVEVLQDPWATEPDTYSALIEALVVYCQSRDKEAVKLCYEYFEARRALKREIAREVTVYLIRELPDAMVNPILDFWCENPMAWTESLNMLGYRVQTPLLERLRNTTNLRLIGSILKYLEDRGTKEALPVVETFLEYPDSIIRHSAKTTYKTLQTR